MLGAEGIEAEVIDPRTTVPLDRETLIASTERTGRAIVVDEGYASYGVGSEIAAMIAEGAFFHLDMPVRKLGASDVPIPFSPTLEDLTVPTPELVATTARSLCGLTDLERGNHGTPNLRSPDGRLGAADRL